MKNEFKVNKEKMMSWAKEFYLHGTANIILFILWCFVGLCGLCQVVLYSIYGGDWINWYIAIIFLLLSVYKLFFERFVVISRRYKLYSKTYGVTEWIRTVEFADEEIIITDHSSVSKHKYENIKKIKEKNDVVMIFINNNMAIRIYKNAFVEGSWEECKEMLKAKTTL
ncbi:MAG: YcxB family protein [Clostridia bacterium]|nr:YcxB family protein [Clostridia bacterium]